MVPKRDKNTTMRVAFVSSPARFPDQILLSRGIKMMESKNLKVIKGRSCSVYLSDQEKARELEEAFANPEVDFIIASRGGHGSFRLLEYLDWERIKQNPKPIVGYSDITALLLAIHFKTGIITYHGPMVTVELDNDEKSLENMLAVLNGEKVIHFAGEREAIVPGKMTGRLIVGNLSLFKTLQGTEYFGSLKDAILVLEDVGESRESIERMVWGIANLEEYEELRGIIFAGFTNIRNADFEEIIEILKSLFSDSPFPVWIGLPVFHGDFPKLTLPVGAWVSIDMEKGVIEILDDPLLNN
ncbi:peptidase U61 [Kosmotoga pacifica]|uniref:Peptidase U61 n=1 Tax=Kosmotoga pacifica TaxID=1330330 RepID=A0A0G2ZFN0_9BACT|nr:peptidase U61 [Kosmotoga pacifica]